ncbi:MAG: glycoside hydrolase family 140 protein [Chitinophagaceae bacterium]
MPLLKISDNKRYFQTADGKPFFWLGDTGWLLFTKCSREEALHYLDKRQQQGFNVVQIMLLHTLKATDVYGDSALVNGNIAQPDLANGYWKHVDFILHEAAKRGIYMALVPVWGGNVKEGKITAQQATLYAAFLARRFKNENNIVWLNGGDIKGSDGLQVWKAIGTTIKKYDPRHLQTFHPRGRTSSSEWFHKEAWLDFNMFQSGHKDYAQDTSSNEQHHYGEDNWKFVQADYKLLPVKPSMDGEPSYENIPHGLHDSLAERWTAADLRRYAYWSVLAGGAGFTYGENAVMQFNTRGDRTANFGVSNNWNNTIDAPGAGEMKYLKQLMLAVSYFDRVPAQEIIVDNTRDRYHYLLASKGQKYVMVYVYTGRNFSLDLSALHFKAKKAGWFNPKNGTTTAIDDFKAAGVLAFDPPGEEAEGNDWVLLIE